MSDGIQSRPKFDTNEFCAASTKDTNDGFVLLFQLLLTPYLRPDLYEYS